MDSLDCGPSKHYPRRDRRMPDVNSGKLPPCYTVLHGETKHKRAVELETKHICDEPDGEYDLNQDTEVWYKDADIRCPLCGGRCGHTHETGTGFRCKSPECGLYFELGLATAPILNGLKVKISPRWPSHE